MFIQMDLALAYAALALMMYRYFTDLKIALLQILYAIYQ